MLASASQLYLLLQLCVDLRTLDLVPRNANLLICHLYPDSCENDYGTMWARRSETSVKNLRFGILDEISPNREPDALGVILRRVHSHDAPGSIEQGPPLLPGLIAALVWIIGSRLAETIPSVTVYSNPSGIPIATT